MSFSWKFSLAVLVLVPSFSLAGTFKITQAVGDVIIERSGQVVRARVGEFIDGVSAIRTASDGAVQLSDSDGATIFAAENTEIRIAGADRSLALVRGRVGLWANDKVWSIDAVGTPLRARGYLSLHQCADGCQRRNGLYGKVTGGEVIVEYAGGRSIVRDRLFYLSQPMTKPEMLARDDGALSTPPRFDAALAVKDAAANEIRLGLDAFKAERYAQAREHLLRARNHSPGEAIVAYYLGLIALESERSEEALKELQRYVREDAEGARERGVGQLLTLLTTSELKKEVAAAIEQEKRIAEIPPEPGSIAVQAFASRASKSDAALAKGIAAMVISDLSKVPGLKVLEREKVQKISDEIRLSESGLVESETAVRAGRLMRAERVVVGNLGVE